MKSGAVKPKLSEKLAHNSREYIDEDVDREAKSESRASERVVREARLILSAMDPGVGPCRL